MHSTGSVGIAAVAVAIVVVVVISGVVFMVYWKRHMVSCGSVHGLFALLTYYICIISLCG